MKKSKRISVTPNVEYSLKTLKEAIEELPEGEMKDRAGSALRYLMSAAKGEKQTLRGINCVDIIKIMP